MAIVITVSLIAWTACLFAVSSGHDRPGTDDTRTESANRQFGNTGGKSSQPGETQSGATEEGTESSGSAQEAADTQDRYVRAVTYFGDSWPAAFWNSSGESLSSDLALIRADGFNAVILVVPWNEFQPARLKGENAQYAFSYLKRILSAAREKGLTVYLRLGYAWDFACDGSVPGCERMNQVLYDEETQREFLAFAGEIYETVSGSEAFGGAFLCWEDFWNLAQPSLESERVSERIERARTCGLQTYLRTHYTKSMISRLCGAGNEEVSVEDIPFPTAQDPLMSVVYAYYDERMCELLTKTRAVFPGVTMEVRSDLDPVVLPDGTQSVWEHKAFYAVQESAVCAMYGIYQGWDNGGAVLSAAQALEMTRKTLRRLDQNCAGRSLFLDQFNFVDNTPGYEDNARLAPDQETVYLGSVGNILMETSSGYGLWTWRDYKTDVIYNGQFATGGSGWTLRTGGAEVISPGMRRLMQGSTVFFQPGEASRQAVEKPVKNMPGNQVCTEPADKEDQKDSLPETEMEAFCTSAQGPGAYGFFLSRGQILCQSIPAYRKLIEADAWILELELETGAPATVTITVGERTYRIENAVSGRYVLATDRYESVRIQTDQDILVRRVRLWNHLQSQRIRGADLEPMDNLGAIRALNRQTG